MRTRILILLPVALLLLLAPGRARAWSKESQIQIAWEAARLGPPDLYRQIVRHKLRYRDGLLAPYANAAAEYHEKNGDGTGQLDEVILAETERAIYYIRAHYPFADIVEQLGVLLHYVNDANNPLQTSSADPAESGYHQDYLSYIRSAEPRFAAAYYGLDTRLDDLKALPDFVDRTITRSRRLYPYIGNEYRRIGEQSGVDAFDDRSTAFGVAAVSFSRALTDAVAVLRFVWLEAGGGDPVARAPLAADKLVKVPRIH
ncbi:MAG: hypothetical protein R3190_09240 [Thermoanaerobaculia bacterium]|nr:hypothetical protein [Thermoanaerobaculia bacterium]